MWALGVAASRGGGVRLRGHSVGNRDFGLVGTKGTNKLLRPDKRTAEAKGKIKPGKGKAAPPPPAKGKAVPPPAKGKAKAPPTTKAKKGRLGTTDFGSLCYLPACASPKSYEGRLTTPPSGAFRLCYRPSIS